MNFNDHSDYANKHSFLSASKNSWVNWNQETLVQRYIDDRVTTIGTLMHDLAKQLIRKRITLTDQDQILITYHLMTHGIPEYSIDLDWLFPNFKAYVNDAIDLRMIPEQTLVYSENAFATTDAIAFSKTRGRGPFLRIHDYKSGKTPVTMTQLEIYAAYFFLEYGRDQKVSPENTGMELRVYQSGAVACYEPEPNDILNLMEQIKQYDSIIDSIKNTGRWMT